MLTPEPPYGVRIPDDVARFLRAGLDRRGWILPATDFAQKLHSTRTWLVVATMSVGAAASLLESVLNTRNEPLT
jgi:hypothetical protein